MNGLDYEIIFDDEGEFQLWTPDTTGAILGCGKTEVEAMGDAINNMQALCAVLKEKRLNATP